MINKTIITIISSLVYLISNQNEEQGITKKGVVLSCRYRGDDVWLSL